MSKFIPFTDEELYQAHHKDIKEYLESIGEKVLHAVQNICGKHMTA